MVAGGGDGVVGVSVCVGDGDDVDDVVVVFLLVRGGGRVFTCCTSCRYFFRCGSSLPLPPFFIFPRVCI